MRILILALVLTIASCKKQEFTGQVIIPACEDPITVKIIMNSNHSPIVPIK